MTAGRVSKRGHTALRPYIPSFLTGTALALIGAPADAQTPDARVLAIGRPTAEAPVARDPLPSEVQAAAFLDRLEAGDPRGARAALPAGIRLGHRDFPERLAWFGQVTGGCTRGRTFVSEFYWLDQARRPRPPWRPSRLPPGHRILLAGAPPPGAEYRALSSLWDCPGDKPDIVIYFYLVDDRIVRVAYDRPPNATPPPPSPPRR
jgi:hypothetical protein